jgi:hypothetical protein
MAATFLRVPRARVVHEDAAHHAGGHREEMCAVVPRDVFRVDEPKVRLVDQYRCLEALAGALSRHAAPRDLLEFSMDQRNQSLEGTLVALPPFEKEPGDSGGVLRNFPF